MAHIVISRPEGIPSRGNEETPPCERDFLSPQTPCSQTVHAGSRLIYDITAEMPEVAASLWHRFCGSLHQRMLKVGGIFHQYSRIFPCSRHASAATEASRGSHFRSSSCRKTCRGFRWVERSPKILSLLVPPIPRDVRWCCRCRYAAFV